MPNQHSNYVISSLPQFSKYTDVDMDDINYHYLLISMNNPKDETTANAIAYEIEQACYPGTIHIELLAD